MELQGRCTNYTKCLTGYRCATITIDAGAKFVCPECGKPLTPLAEEPKEAPKWIKPAMKGLAWLLLLLVGFWGIKKLYPVVRRAVSEHKAAAAPAAVQPATQEVAQTSSQKPAEIPAAATQAATPASPPRATPALLEGDANSQVKREVLKRIDLMPNVAPANKDKLYVNVERARDMRKVATIAFDSGKTTPASSDVERLKTELEAPQIKKLLEDPTIVFVILGYADTTGDRRSNIRVSQSRGQSVLEAMRDRCGIVNVMYVIAMGGSNLLDKEGVGKNRAAEVWAVLP